ncbi:MAG: DNA-binding response regulator, partial [Mesorhizobium sp.]
ARGLINIDALRREQEQLDAWLAQATPLQEQ